ncbi:MAG: hypothetical protein QW543_04065 [Sulfolobales archaeon]
MLVVNNLWSLNKVPSIKTLHKMFYNELRKHSFRAHHVKQVYTYAKAVVRASKQSGGKKPVLRRLTARLDKYDYRLDLENRTLILKIHNGREVKLRLLTSTERVEKFRGWSNYEIAVKVVEDNVYVSVYFRRAVEPRRTRTVMAIDVNFDNATLAVFTPEALLRNSLTNGLSRSMLKPNLALKAITLSSAQDYFFSCSLIIALAISPPSSDRVLRTSSRVAPVCSIMNRISSSVTC